MALLVRGRSMFSPKVSKTSLKPHEKPVQGGLAITPSDIERLAQQGVAVSVPNADSFLYNNEDGFAIDPVYARDEDRNSLWERSQIAKARIMKARKRDAEKYT